MLYIIKKDFFLADYILDSLVHHEDIKIIPYCRNKAPKGLLNKLLFLAKRHIRAFYINKKGLWTADFFSTTLLEELENVSSKDHILFWGVENLKEMLILQKEIKTNELYFFLWNPISTINRNQYSKHEYAQYIQKHKLRVYTFDKNDAIHYKLKLVKQVYRMPDEASSSLDVGRKDIFFIGKDKKRTKALSELLAFLNKEGLSYYFHILTDKHTKINAKYADCFYQKGLSYMEVIEKIRGCRCIVEILQIGQSGMSIRALEALFFQKKLITNNQEIIKEPFYHPNNIYIIGKDEERVNLTDFINSPFTTIPNKVLYPYQIEYWIKQFMNQNHEEEQEMK